MNIASRLEFYLTEKGRFDCFPIHVLGYPLLLVFGCMGLCFDIMGIGDHSNGLRIFSLLGIIVAIVCLFLFKGSKPRPSVGIFTILTIYLVIIIICAVPYLFFGFDLKYAFFESISGVTTTGMSVMHLSQMEDQILMWRAVTGWIGGFMFISLFCLYIGDFALPGRFFFASGTASVDSEVYTPQIIKIAMRYGMVYLASTFVMALLLIITGVDIQMSARMAMSTVSTTGFQDVHGGLDAFEPASRVVIGLFMFISLINFTTVFFAIAKRTFRPFREDNENLYLFSWLLIIGAIASVLLIQFGDFPDDAEGVLDFLLVVLSNASTTGFMVYDYNWPAALVLTFSLLAVIGGCIDSPTGGIKVARAAISLKIMKKEITEVAFPNQVSTIRIRRVNVSRDLAYGALLTMLTFFIVLIGGTILISFTELNMEDALCLATSALTTTGKGLYSLGDITDVNTFAQCVCAVLMIIGRLEAVLFLMILSPDFWRDLVSRINIRKLISDRHPRF